MPINEGKEGPAILVFAMPKKPGRGVTPPAMAPSKKSDKSGLPDMGYEEEDECEYCEGDGCEHCEDDAEEPTAEGSHKSHMKIIAKLAKMLEGKNEE